MKPQGGGSSACRAAERQQEARRQHSACSAPLSTTGVALVLLLALQQALVADAAGVCSTVAPVCNGRSRTRVDTEALPLPAWFRRRPGFAVYRTAGSSAQEVPQRVAYVAKERAAASDSGAALTNSQRLGRLMSALAQPAAADQVAGVMPPLNKSKALHVVQGEESVVAVQTAAAQPAVHLPGTEAGARLMAESGPDAVPNGQVFLSNQRLRVGLDMAHGGSITHLSSPAMPRQWANRNLVNTWDAGRLIQQSYYGCPDGSCWSTQPWTWNPVQGGSWQNRLPMVLDSQIRDGFVRVSSHPRNWGGQQLLKDVVMTTEVTVLENVVKVHCVMTYNGTVAHPARHQELPAIFVSRQLNVLATYTGNAPWKGQPPSYLFPGGRGEYFKPTEKWAAYLDEASGYGLGVYSPAANNLVAYRVGPDTSSARSDCSYLAPLTTAAIKPGMRFAYDYYVAIGRLDQMRRWFGDIAAGRGGGRVVRPHRPAPIGFLRPPVRFGSFSATAEDDAAAAAVMETGGAGAAAAAAGNAPEGGAGPSAADQLAVAVAAAAAVAEIEVDGSSLLQVG